MTTSPRIYVADLAAYNAGYLHGAWIDATQDSDKIYLDVQEMLADGQKLYAQETLGIHEEWAIHDFDNFGAIRLSEWDSFETVSELGKALDEHGQAYAEYVSIVGETYASVDNFEEKYIGEMSLLDYAHDYIESTGELDENSTLARYFDYEAFARDLRLGGDVVESGGYLFHGNI